MDYNEPTACDGGYIYKNDTVEKRVVDIALCFATYAGTTEASGRDFGFGADSIENREKYLEWAKEFDLLGYKYGDDYYEELSRFFANKIKDVP